MRLLIISFHYPPDLGAGAFRAEALVHALREHGGSELEIDVFTCLPNRYRSHDPEAERLEVQGNIRIHRFPVQLPRPGMFALGLAYLSFFRKCRRQSRGQQWDLVFATASRLIPALIGAVIARKKQARLFLDFRDLIVDNLSAVKPQWWWWPILGVLERLETWVIGRADGISVVSEAFVPTLRSRGAESEISVYPNGIDHHFIAIDGNEGGSSRDQWQTSIQVVYAGNIGVGQGLDRFLPGLAEKLQGRAEFVVYGDGACRFTLEKSLELRGIKNVRVLDPVARARLPDIYLQADVLLMHLAPLPAMEYALPSKVFEYAASGRPVWAGVAGHAARLIEDEIENASVFPPGDVSAAIRALEELQLTFVPRESFCERYGRKRIMSSMAREILNLASDTIAAEDNES